MRNVPKMDDIIKCNEYETKTCAVWQKITHEENPALTENRKLPAVAAVYEQGP